ncbi:MAG: hypothetical protein LUG95_01195 [Clostridiales bacterium]|nr:hypothetical protein [Clostridiales bacterium]
MRETGRMNMKINELASEYKMQYEILRAKIDGLRPLLRIYDGTDLVLLRKK